MQSRRASRQGFSCSLILACAGALAALGAGGGAVACDEGASAPADAIAPSGPTGNTALDAALAELAPGAPLEQAAMLAALAVSPRCFPGDLTKEQWADVLRNNPDLLPPTQSFPISSLRYWTDTTVWTGASQQGPSGQAAAASLTYSFPADGVTWGLASISSTGPNDLNSKLMTAFGAADLDEGREYMRQALASWRSYCRITYTEVADNNTPMAEDVAPNPARGDIRMGGLPFGTGQFLAYDAFPSAGGIAGVGGSDMVINTSFFLPANFTDSSNSYRYFRNTVAHEHGHGLSNIHSTPCNATKLMEPSIQLGVDGVAIDEIRGGGRNYGDRRSGNNAPTTAYDYGDLTAPVVHSIIDKRLSTNGATGADDTNMDWFRFTIGSTQNVVLSAAPAGGSYSAGQQFISCFGSNATINAMQAGNLNIELRDAVGTGLLMSAASGGAGATETITANGLAPGTYTVRVVDVGPNASANQVVQLYDLTIRVGLSHAVPTAIAGLHKRIAANTNCFFMGDINSRANETSAFIASYDWDLDGDGSYDVSGGKVNTQYVSNGVYPVTLRVTDNGGMTDTDTINVTVFGATTTLTDVNPPSGEQGQTVPVAITGTNLKNVASASEFTVAGAGVTVIGTPVPNALGTIVSGLSLMIDAGAATGARTVSVSNADGSADGVGLFTVNAGAACPADLDGDGQVGASDLAILLGSWGGTGAADFDGGGVGASDLAILLGSWGACP